ncbi:unnamed protein product [Rangifer tarandus platyrhynchus]|uniref:Uncharacterized protein n=1 Tax=Rangifer tarandus platyrhynchus TaxID=3082113 RepID=A0ABN8ZYQ1_RANTA|nr:unnamed protein product [Rangifer tarandus platyrhynchus]
MELGPGHRSGKQNLNNSSGRGPVSWAGEDQLCGRGGRSQAVGCEDVSRGGPVPWRLGLAGEAGGRHMRRPDGPGAQMGGLTRDLSGNPMQNEKTKETAGLSELHSQE